MPTIPLYDVSAPPDGYHRVTAPGGYEWWHVVASADPQEMQFTIDFLDGDTFDVGYRRAYERYVKRPMSVPPPLPRDHPAARVILTEQTVPSRVFGMPVPRGAFRYSEPPRAVSVGESSLVWRADGSLAITLRGFATTTSDGLLEGELELMLTDPPAVEPAPVRKRGIIKGVLREVSGGVVRRTLGVSGDAQYTHSFGVKPFELC
jgi:hypothetical protein